MSIKTVGLVGTGVIGSSWATLFLARGLRVVISDPAPGAKERLEAYSREQWPLMQRIGLSPDADPNNWQFVENVADHLSEVDYVQEVCIYPASPRRAPIPAVSANGFLRMLLKTGSSRRSCLRSSMLRRHLTLSWPPPRLDFHRRSSLAAARRPPRGS